MLAVVLCTPPQESRLLVADPTAKISRLADIDESVRGTKIHVGPHAVIDSFVRIKCAGGTEDVHIGAYCFINSGTVIYTGNGLRMGTGVLIAANCTIAPVNHAYRSKDRTILEQRFPPSKGGITIEDDVWVGAGSVVLDGTIIRRGAVVGACSLVRGELESYGIYAGTPLTRVGQRV
jgi:acetyltransferase-like isoleucine patch superfamily enzyme